MTGQPDRRPVVAERRVALFRGINVGRAKRIVMADLRATLTALGYGDVRTLLNSGNAVFTATGEASAIAARIEAAVESQLGVSSRVTVLSAAEVAAVLAANRLAGEGRHPSRLLVTEFPHADACARLAPLARESWSPEELSLGERVAYLWCPNGVAESALVQAVGRVSGTEVTTRNWATFSKVAKAATLSAGSPA